MNPRAARRSGFRSRARSDDEQYCKEIRRGGATPHASERHEYGPRGFIRQALGSQIHGFRPPKSGSPLHRIRLRIIRTTPCRRRCFPQPARWKPAGPHRPQRRGQDNPHARRRRLAAPPPRNRANPRHSPQRQPRRPPPCRLHARHPADVRQSHRPRIPPLYRQRL